MASAVAASSSPLFYLFKSPLVHQPSYEFGRRISNQLSKAAYIKFFENDFTNEGLIRGIKQVSFLINWYYF